MYKSSTIAEDIVWHHKGRIKDDVLGHPADAKMWKVLILCLLAGMVYIILPFLSFVLDIL